MKKTNDFYGTIQSTDQE